MYYNYNPQDKENRPTMIWLGILTFGIIWTIFEAPLSFVLDYKIQEHHMWWDGLFCCIFLVDIVLRIRGKLRLPEQTRSDFSEESKEMTPYHKSIWLPIDILTSLPFDIIAHALGLGVPAVILKGLRISRLIRIVKLRFIFDIFDFIPKKIKVVLIITAVMTIVHWISCGWMLINPNPSLDPVTYYNLSLYWAITTLTTVGYGDITPQTNLARIYTMGVMLFGVSIFGLLISHFFRMMMIADKYTEEKKEKMHSLKEFMRYYNIPNSLQKQVFSFYNHLLTQNVNEEDSRIVNDLPQALQNELNLFMKIKLIKDVHIFKGFSIACLKMIAGKLDQTFHSPNEYIIRKGDIGNEMFIIGHGGVQVVVGEKVVSELKAGQFFGEIALLEDTIRNADVQTKTYCDLYILNKEDFLEVIEKYPKLGERFDEIYKKRESDTRLKTSTKKAA